MKLGSIVVIAAKEKMLGDDPNVSRPVVKEDLFPGSLACIEVGGTSVLERMIDRYLQAGVEAVVILVETGLPSSLFSTAREGVEVQFVDDLGSAIARRLSDFSSDGIEHAFVNSADAYVEVDLLDFVYFHRESRQASTRASDDRGPLDLWVADCAKAQVAGMGKLSNTYEPSGNPYLVRGYISRLMQPRDLRQFSIDVLNGRCQVGPSGNEIRPRVWIGEGAELHSRARVVAPAYIGCRSKIREDAVITRSSNIERDCFIDSATVIDNSSVLPNTHIGICLDVCNAVVEKNKFLSLDRGVTIAISEPRVMRSTGTDRGKAAGLNATGRWQKATTDIPAELPLRGAWQLGTNLFQE